MIKPTIHGSCHSICFVYNKKLKVRTALFSGEQPVTFGRFSEEDRGIWKIVIVQRNRCSGGKLARSTYISQKCDQSINFINPKVSVIGHFELDLFIIFFLFPNGAEFTRGPTPWTFPALHYSVTLTIRTLFEMHPSIS